MNFMNSVNLNKLVEKYKGSRDGIVYQVEVYDTSVGVIYRSICNGDNKPTYSFTPPKLDVLLVHGEEENEA